MSNSQVMDAYDKAVYRSIVVNTVTTQALISLLSARGIINPGDIEKVISDNKWIEQINTAVVSTEDVVTGNNCSVDLH